MLPFLFAQEAKNGYELFFINQMPTQEEYQKYVGETIAFFEPESPAQYLFNLEGIELGTPYTINKITMYYALAVPHVDFVVTKVGSGNVKGIHIKCRNTESTEKEPGVLDIPAHLYQPVKDLKDKYLQKRVLVHGKQYRIADFDYCSRRVSFVFLADDGDCFTEPVFTALDYTVDDSLIGVEKPENEAIMYGNTTIVTEDDIAKYSYVDNVLGIQIINDGEKFAFSILNLSDNTLRIIWDEAAFVDVNGSTSKIIHSGIKYNEIEKAQIPSIIVKGSKISDIAIPTNNIEYNKKLGWNIKKMFKPKQEGIVALLLPVQIKGVTNEYLFVFKRSFVLRHPELHE